MFDNDLAATMSRNTAEERFLDAHSKALRQDFVARLAGRPNDLLPFEALIHILETYEQIVHRDPEMIDLDKIVGSVGRYKDFTRDFLPRKSSLRERWLRVEQNLEGQIGLPPIEVFKVGNVYFVADGNHRVSVARANGFDQIEAYVTEYPIDPDIEPGDSLDEALLKAGRTRFFAETRLDERIPGVDIFLTKPGGYRQLLEHVDVHRRMLQEHCSECGDITTEEAAEDWYWHSYEPIVTAVRDRGLLERFPGRTAADLYVWVWRTILQSRRALGRELGPEEGAALLESSAPNAFRRTVQELMGRLGEMAHVLRREPDDLPDWAGQGVSWGDDSAQPFREEGSIG